MKNKQRIEEVDRLLRIVSELRRQISSAHLRKMEAEILKINRLFQAGKVEKAFEEFVMLRPRLIYLNPKGFKGLHDELKSYGEKDPVVAIESFFEQLERSSSNSLARDI